MAKEPAVEFNRVQDGELLKWGTVGEKLTGILKSYTSRPDTGKGEGHVYEVQSKDGVVPFFAPSLLHKKLQEVAIGNVVQIEYTKQSKTGSGNTLKHFEVAFAKPTEANLKALGLEVLQKVEDGEDEGGL